jgi:signal transduction histidine kinase
MEDFHQDIAAIARIDVIPSILEVVCRTTGMGFAAVARVTEDRWIVCAVRDAINFGLKPGGELKVQTTICDEIRGSGDGVVIDHVAENAAFRDHHTPAMYGFQSYISMPIRLQSGEFFGTLCAIDPQPARLNTPEVIGMFKLFADLISHHLQAQQRLAQSESALRDERLTAELREQFIAVVGHDLRNPLASIDAAGQVLAQVPFDPRSAKAVTLIQRSAKRMGALIDNVLDFARGRLGGGLALATGPAEPLAPVLEQVIAELHAARPDCAIRTDIDLAQPIACDRTRIAQLFSNLLGNALVHGTGGLVSVRAEVREGVFGLSVANQGDPIPEIALAQLFQPFYRAATGNHRQGLGLGLYIAAEIARAHGGTLEAISDIAETRFTFRMPV